MSEDNLEQSAEKVNLVSEDLKIKLKEIFDPNLDTWGHGTTPEKASELIEKGAGLRARSPDLTTTAIPLLDRSKTYEEQINGVVEKVMNWPHLSSKAIVIVMTPNPPEPEPAKEGEIRRQRHRSSAFFQDNPEFSGDYAYDFPCILPAKYIKGYFDVATEKFIPNPNFNPTPPDQVSSIRINNKPLPATSMSETPRDLSPHDLLP